MPISEKFIGERVISAFDKIITQIISPNEFSTPPSSTPFEVSNPTRPSEPADWFTHPFHSDKVIYIPPRVFSLLLESFSKEEFAISIAKLKSKSASGSDMITNSMIRHLSSVSLSFLRKTFNLMFHKSRYPSSWQEFYVIFIPKSNNSAVRLISLANCLMKLFETLVKLRLEWALEHFGLHSEAQFGFRRGLSCSDNVNILCTEIELQKSRSKMIGVVFLDIARAFDNVLLPLLLRILRGIGIPSKLIKFVEHIISRRIVEGFQGGTSFDKPIASRKAPFSVQCCSVYTLWALNIF